MRPPSQAVRRPGRRLLELGWRQQVLAAPRPSRPARPGTRGRRALPDAAALVDALRSGHLVGACRGIHPGLSPAALSEAAAASPARTRARSASRQTSTARGHHASTWSASPYQCREMTFA
jgi:hypothetical protein